MAEAELTRKLFHTSQCSPVWKTGTMSSPFLTWAARVVCLNVVRSGRPEQLGAGIALVVLVFASQCSPVWKTGTIRIIPGKLPMNSPSLNVVRSGRPEQ